MGNCISSPDKAVLAPPLPQQSHPTAGHGSSGDSEKLSLPKSKQQEQDRGKLPGSTAGSLTDGLSHPKMMTPPLGQKSLAKLSASLHQASAPSTPQQDMIPAMSAQETNLERSMDRNLNGQPVPSPVSKAPTGVLIANPEVPYAAPFVPAPSVPPPESPGTTEGEHEVLSWQPCRKRALLVGVNYSECSEPGAKLRGCVNDAHCLLHMLTTKFGFQASSIILLHDEQLHPEYLPTKANILEAMRWLTAGAQAGDSLFFGFSGHGVPAEEDHLPDVLLPSDFREGGSLSGQELMESACAHLPAGCKLHCIIDPCQGIVALDLPAQVATRADGWAAWEDDENNPDAPARASPRGDAGGEVLWFTSTLPTPHDLDPEAQAIGSFASTGATTFALIQAVEKGQAATYNMLLRAMRYALKNGPNHFAAALADARSPPLLCTHPFDLNRPFIM